MNFDLFQQIFLDFNTPEIWIFYHPVKYINAAHVARDLKLAIIRKFNIELTRLSLVRVDTKKLERLFLCLCYQQLTKRTPPRGFTHGLRYLG